MGIVGARDHAHGRSGCCVRPARCWSIWCPTGNLAGCVRTRLEVDGDRVTDLHLWRLGPGHTGADRVGGVRPPAGAGRLQGAPRGHRRAVARHRRGAPLRGCAPAALEAACRCGAKSRVCYSGLTTRVSPARLRFSMSVDADTVRRIAHLARIAVAEEEVEHLQGRAQRHAGLRRAAVGGRRRGRRADDLGHADGDEEARGRGHRRRHRRRHRQECAGDARIISFWCPRWWNEDCRHVPIVRASTTLFGRSDAEP